MKKESEKIGVPARLRRKSWKTPQPPNLQQGLQYVFVCSFVCLVGAVVDGRQWVWFGFWAWICG